MSETNKAFAAATNSETALVLRVCNADMTSHGGFRWPADGYVEAYDWKPKAECGNGLHGWLWGEGDVSGGTATAGTDGALQLLLWDPTASRHRRKLALVGENGIEANVPYKLDKAGNFVRADKAQP